LNYPDYEVIVVNDGSKDRTLEISERHKAVYDADPGGPRMLIISQENKGLSVARNVGAQAASGEIVAYTDSDCVPDPDWLAFLVYKFVRSGFVAVGGPNFPPPEPYLVPAAVAASPGGPTHVLLNDEVAEHVPGCNMAFTKKALEEIGGFEPGFAAAGDDVDLCSRRPIIYFGAFGRGLFQSMYEPPSSLLSYLPFTLEWNAIGLLLVLATLVSPSALPIAALPLAVSLVWSVATALRARVDPRFGG